MQMFYNKWQDSCPDFLINGIALNPFSIYDGCFHIRDAVLYLGVS